MAKKAKAKKAAPKKSTYYERNRKAIRKYQQKRRGDIKAGKVVPVTGSGKTGRTVSVKKGKKEERLKIVGELHSESPEAKAIYKKRYYYKDHAKTLKRQKGYDSKHAEKKRLAFLAYYDKKYPPPKPD